MRDSQLDMEFVFKSTKTVLSSEFWVNRFLCRTIGANNWLNRKRNSWHLLTVIDWKWHKNLSWRKSFRTETLQVFPYLIMYKTCKSTQFWDIMSALTLCFFSSLLIILKSSHLEGWLCWSAVKVPYNQTRGSTVALKVKMEGVGFPGHVVPLNTSYLSYFDHRQINSWVNAWDVSGPVSCSCSNTQRHKHEPRRRAPRWGG